MNKELGAFSGIMLGMAIGTVMWAVIIFALMRVFS